MGNYVASTADKLDHNAIDDSRVVTRYESHSNSPMSDPNLQMAVQSLDALISRVLTEKALQMGQQQQQPLGATNRVAENQVNSRVDAQLASAFVNLASLLSPSKQETRDNDKSTTVMANAPMYRCPMGSNQSGEQSSAACKVNYKNLFPRPSEAETAAADSLFGGMLSSYQVQDITNGPLANNQQRRNSSNVANDSSGLDTIRINLPEILDQHDEITILRLLIKLLSTKVTKLSDERRRLLQSITALSDINAEMAAIIEREFDIPK